MTNPADEAGELREVAWVLEGGDGYWTGRSLFDLDLDHGQAMRFARKEDAERVRLWLIQNEGVAGRVFSTAIKATEHVWISPSPRTTP